MFTPSDLLGASRYWISGFQFGYIPFGDGFYDYHDYLTSESEGWTTFNTGLMFYSDDPTYLNIIVAPFYDLGPTSTMQVRSVENRDAILWDAYGNTSAATVTGSQEIWHYDDVEGIPQWFYRNISFSGTTGKEMHWAAATYDNMNMSTRISNINQNGIDRTIYTDMSWLGNMGTYTKDLTGTYRAPHPFETAYANMTVDVVIPVYEIIAIRPPAMSTSMSSYTQYAITLTSSTPQAANLQPYIKLDNSFDRNTIHTVPAWDIPYANNILSVNCKTLYANGYIYAATLPGGSYGGTTEVYPYELGTIIGNDPRTFEYMVYKTSSQTYAFIVMGQNGDGYNMCLARRIKYLKHRTIQIDQYVNNSYILPS